MAFPQTRLRRLRSGSALRGMVRETRLAADNLICPLFVRGDRKEKTPVASMPGVFHLPLGQLQAEVRELRELGIPAVLLFGLPGSKDAEGSSAWQAGGVVQQATAEIKQACPDMLVITDVCLCAYTDHGHCGLLTAAGIIDNDRTVELLARQALSHARAGCDMVAPSDMMDGRVGAIRQALDRGGYSAVPIMSYAVKYASAFYGPFREAVASAPAFGDRRTHQMDPGNVREAIREALLDLEEGADIIMVKPALSYLDVIRAVREACTAPVAAYAVSGEYAMIKAAAGRGWIDERAMVLEVLTAIQRAGADMIITYSAKDAARWLRA